MHHEAAGALGWAACSVAEGAEFCFAAHVTVFSLLLPSHAMKDTLSHPQKGVSSAVVITFTLCMTGTGNCANTRTLLSDVTQAWWLEAETPCAIIRSTCQDGEEGELVFIYLPQQSYWNSWLPNSKWCAEESYTTTPSSFLADAARESEPPAISMLWQTVWALKAKKSLSPSLTCGWLVHSKPCCFTGLASVRVL